MIRQDWILIARSLVFMALVFYIGVSILEAGPGLSLSSWREGQKRLWKRPTKALLVIFATLWTLVVLLILCIVLFAHRDLQN